MKIAAAWTLLLLSSPCLARDLYTCTSASGAKVFSDTPCGKNAKTMEMRQLQTVGDSPAVRDAAAAAEQERQAAADRAAATPPPTPAPAAPESYRCNVPNGEVFYQHSHCPSSVQVQTVTWVGNRPVTTTQFAPVEAVGVSRREACAAIRKDDHRAGSSRDESYSLYDRRELRDPCGR